MIATELEKISSRRVALLPVKRGSCEHRDEAVRPKLTIVIPCFNERATLMQVIESVKALPVSKTIIVVDNSSTDGTREVLRRNCVPWTYWPVGPEFSRSTECQDGQELLRGDGFWVVLQPQNFSKGMSVRLGIAMADSDYVVCQDADLEYEPSDIMGLLEHAQRRGATAVFGARIHRSPSIGDAYYVGRKGLTALFRCLNASSVTDVATCYKLMLTDTAKKLNLQGHGFSVDFEIAARLCRQGHRIEEVPISYHPRGIAEGKKIRWRDGVEAVWTLIRYRFLMESKMSYVASRHEHAEGWRR